MTPATIIATLAEARGAYDAGHYDQALACARSALYDDPTRNEARVFSGLALWKLGRPAEAATELRLAAGMILGDPRLLVVCAEALAELGLLDDAADALERTLQGAPQDVRSLEMLGRVYLAQRRDADAVDVVQRALALAPTNTDVLALFGRLSLRLEEPAAVEMAVALLRENGGSDHVIAPLQRELDLMRKAGVTASGGGETSAGVPVDDRRVWKADEIVFVCGRTSRAWSPRSLEAGIGGSEEAVIRLSRELTRLGWRVTVYAHCGEDAGIYENVDYRPFEAFNREDRFNVLVGWRNVRLFDRPLDAAQRYLWLHDLPDARAFTRARLAHIDRIMVLSDFHRGCLPQVPDDRFFVTGNGIDPDPFERVEARGIRRLPHRCLYASSYNRGLEVLLGMWGEVRRAVPGAELAVCYGWESFAEQFGDPTFERWRASMEQLMRQEGVLHLGRISQDAVLEETFRAGILAYPATFAETSCITAMKAQAGGAVPVVLDYAALAETVAFGTKVPADADGRCGPERRTAYRDALVAALRDPEWQERVRREMMPWARAQFAWASVARRWDARFREAAAGRTEVGR